MEREHINYIVQDCDISNADALGIPDKSILFAVCIDWTSNEVSHSWWSHQMETFSALLALCAGNSPVPGEFRAQRPVTWSFDVLFDLHLNKWLSKQLWGRWFEMLSHPFWRHCNVDLQIQYHSPHTILAHPRVLINCRSVSGWTAWTVMPTAL